jgi:signal peptidase II
VRHPRLLGVGAAILVFAVDQATKLWLLRDFDLPARSPYSVAPGVDLVMAWNRGVSYSLLTSDGPTGRYLLIGATLVASVALAVWLWRSVTSFTCLALGLLIGGALGNLVDRVSYGAVVDFVFLHAGSFRWYVFNGADCAITAGVVVLLLEWVFGSRTAGATAAASAPKTP